MSFEEKRHQPAWGKLAKEIHKVTTPKNAMCNNPNHLDLFMNGVWKMSKDPQYLSMPTKDKYSCINLLGSLFGIDCAQSFNLANIILSQSGGLYDVRKMLD